MTSDSTESPPSGFPAKTLVVGGRTVLQTRPRRSRIYGPVTVLHAAPDGSPVLREAARPWTLGWVGSVCGVLVSTERGSVMVQFRRWS